MIVIPTLDLRDRKCVQHAGGSADRAEIRHADPVAVARNWAQLGFSWLHVVDLDAAIRRGSNVNVVREILREVDIELQVGGGVCSEERIDALLDEGASRVVLGTRALEDSWWLEEMTGKHPDELVVACEVRDRRVVTREWARSTPRLVLDAVDELNRHSIAGLLVTAAQQSGRLEGSDLPMLEDLTRACDAPVFAGGDISTMDHLRSLVDRGVSACVVGMALYDGLLDARLIAEEFGA